MFGFTRFEMESTGSAERFPIRVEKFKKKRKFLPVVQHYFWWFVHNCITHPLIGLIPVKPFFQFHDWTSVKLNAGEAAITTEIEELEGYLKQLEAIREGINKLNKQDPEILPGGKGVLFRSDEEPYVSYTLEEAIVDIRRDINRYYREKNIKRKPRTKLHG